ncbi:hypothetical protein [Prosthecobacter debontii]|nr:hypothetical protein [Prosthecobacter debontii]
MIPLRSFLSLIFVLAASLPAAEPLLISQPQPEIASPSFKEPLDKTWSIAHGRWTPREGVLDVVELPENKHVPVLHHKVPLQTAVIECEVRFDKPGTFLVGCDATKHVGRVIVKPDGLSIAEDSVKPSHTLATLKLPVKTGEWHHLRVEWTGDQMAANLDGHTLKAQHPYLATPKTRSWLAVGKAAQVRALKVSGTARAAAK